MLRILPISLLLVIPVCPIGVAQAQQSEAASEPASVQQITLKGVVIAQKKYSFRVESDGRFFDVKPRDDARIALLLNKPYFDWKARTVVVEAKPKNGSVSPDKPARISFPIPTEPLYVIARFRSAAQLDKWKSTKDKRLNYYLISPEKIANHDPTEDERYIAGRLLPGKSNSTATIETDEKKYRVKLGFRTATMNGFSIADLKPYKTKITLSGVKSETTNQVIASSIAFEPIQK